MLTALWCQSTKSLRDSGGMWLVRSVFPTVEIVGNRCCLEDRGIDPQRTCIGMGQDVVAADLVVEGVEAIAGFCLRFRVQRLLQFRTLFGVDRLPNLQVLRHVLRSS